jgi:hypothetical protein
MVPNNNNEDGTATITKAFAEPTWAGGGKLVARFRWDAKLQYEDGARYGWRTCTEYRT